MAKQKAHTGPLDFSETAHGMMQRIIAKADPDADVDADEDPAPESPHVDAGRKGGQARAASLSASERSAIAAKGGEARWAASSE
ncbi:MAG: histone H1 [Chloroflexi bacterium]|nr:histone H1 [Chloroflexota bacterium]